MKRYIVILVSAVLVICGSIGIAGAADQPTTVSIVVKLVAGLTTEEQTAAIARNGGIETATVKALRLHTISVASELLQQTMANYQADPQVERVEQDKLRKAEAIPVDPGYGLQWALAKVGWEAIYGNVTPIGSATVALLDTGVDATHPDLAGRILPGTSLLDGSNGLVDLSGHGTWLAGIIAAVAGNDQGLAGVGYDGVSIVPVTVLNANGEGKDSDIISGVVWAADKGVNVILMAFSNADFSQNLQDAIDYAWEKGAVLVAATGNSGLATPTYPAGDRGVLGVSATTSSDLLATSSNYGQDTFLAAPGTDIYTTSPNGGYSYISGTSASSAFVAGAAAFMKAVDPSLTNGIIVGRLARSADAIGTAGDPNNTVLFGNGRLNMASALADTGSDPVQPAGVPGGGGPFVGPYTAAAPPQATVTVTASPVGAVGGSFSITRIQSNGNSQTSGGTTTQSFAVQPGSGFSITGIQATVNGYNYAGTATVTGTAGVAGTTTILTLNYQLACTAPSITTNPGDQTATYGSANVSFGAAASGNPTPTVQWQLSTNGGTTYGDISGATSTTLTISSPTAAMSGYTYRAVFTNSCGAQTATTNAATLTVNRKDASVTPNAASKTYGDADPAFTGTLAGFLASDNVTDTYNRTTGETVAGSPYTISATLSPAGVLDNYNITYNTANFTINKRAATWTTNPNSKAYGDADPSPLTTGSGTNFVVTDNVTATYARAAGESVTGGPYQITATLSPADVLGNYTITNNGADFTINKRPLTVTATGVNKVYDSTTNATVTLSDNRVSGDVFADSYVSASFTDKNVGNTKTVNVSGISISGTDAGNYTVNTTASTTANITPLSITGSITASNKIYDGTTAATIANRTLSGVLGTDAVNYVGGTATFGDKNVGSGKTVTATGLSLSGTDANNYTVNTSASTTANITAKDITAVTGITASNKVYDGNTSATLNTSAAAFTGMITGDVLTVATATGSFTDKNAGTGKTVNITGITLGGKDAGNYNLTTTTASTTADITARLVTVTADAKQSKIIGAADPVLSYSYSPALVTGDSFSGALTRVAGENAGGYAIQQGTLTLGSNYAITFISATFNIYFGWPGYLQPINDTAHQIGLTMSSFKAGQTIPAKFVLTNAAGAVVLQTKGNPTFTRSANLGACGTETAVEEIAALSADATPVYAWDGSQYHYNWSTKGLSAGKYRIFANLEDGTSQWVDICLK